MAAKEPDDAIDDGIAEPGIEPGASTETMLVTTDSFDEYEQEMSSSIVDGQTSRESTAVVGTISEIQEGSENIPDTSVATDPGESEKALSLDDSEVVRIILFSFPQSSPMRGEGWRRMIHRSETDLKPNTPLFERAIWYIDRCTFTGGCYAPFEPEQSGRQ